MHSQQKVDFNFKKLPTQAIFHKKKLLLVHMLLAIIYNLLVGIVLKWFPLWRGPNFLGPYISGPKK